MSLPAEKLRILENLAEELLKDEPEEAKVQKYLGAAGIPDPKDPIERINKVLLALHFEEAGKDFNE
jgi:hypothetical protein